MDGHFSHLGNHLDDTASNADTASVYDMRPRRYDDDDLETVDGTLSLAGEVIGRGGDIERNYGEEADGLTVAEDVETELPAHACAYVERFSVPNSPLKETGTAVSIRQPASSSVLPATSGFAVLAETLLLLTSLTISFARGTRSGASLLPFTN